MAPAVQSFHDVTPSLMTEVLAQIETFNEYVNSSGFNAVWGPGTGLFFTGGAGTLFTGSGSVRDASPDASQYVSVSSDIEGNRFMPWGTQGNLIVRTFTGMVPLTSYRCRFQMNIGYSSSSGIGGNGAAHTFTAGVRANATRLLVAILDPFTFDPLNPRDNPGIPSDAIIYSYPTVDVSTRSICLILGLCGWADYDFLTTSDAGGNIVVTIGTWDEQFFPALVYFDNIALWQIVDTPPPLPAQRARPQVFGIGRK